MLVKHFHQLSRDLFVDGHPHVNREWGLSVFGLLVTCCSFFVPFVAVVLKHLSNCYICLCCAKPQLRFDVHSIFKHSQILKKSEWNGLLDAPFLEGSIKCGLVVQHMSLQDVSCFVKDDSFTIIVSGL